MNPKTLTTLDQLRIGDSFVYRRRTDPWRVMAMADKNGRVAVNQIHPEKRTPLWRYDDLKKGKTKVLFIRHTHPVAGEEFFIDDLVAGDIFKREATDVHEWELMKHNVPFSDVRRLDQPSNGKAGMMTKIIFIRHKA